MTPPINSVSVDELAQEIRRIDGNNEKGAGELAEGIMEFLAARRAANTPVNGVRLLAAQFEHEVTQQTQDYEFKEGPNGEWMFRCPEWFDLSAVLDAMYSPASPALPSPVVKIDEQALEAAKTAFYGGLGKGFSNPPVGALEQAITAYLSCLTSPAAEPTLSSITPVQEEKPVASGHDPKLIAALNNLRTRLEALPEPLRGPFVVEGLKPYARPASPVSAEVMVTDEAAHGLWRWIENYMENECGHLPEYLSDDGRSNIVNTIRKTLTAALSTQGRKAE